jgi:hypothetical protein
LFAVCDAVAEKNDGGSNVKQKPTKMPRHGERKTESKEISRFKTQAVLFSRDEHKLALDAILGAFAVDFKADAEAIDDYIECVITDTRFTIKQYMEILETNREKQEKKKRDLALLRAQIGMLSEKRPMLVAVDPTPKSHTKGESKIRSYSFGKNTAGWIIPAVLNSGNVTKVAVPDRFRDDVNSPLLTAWKLTKPMVLKKRGGRVHTTVGDADEQDRSIHMRFNDEIIVNTYPMHAICRLTRISETSWYLNHDLTTRIHIRFFATAVWWAFDDFNLLHNPSIRAIILDYLITVFQFGKQILAREQEEARAKKQKNTVDKLVLASTSAMMPNVEPSQAWAMIESHLTELRMLS